MGDTNPETDMIISIVIVIYHEYVSLINSRKSTDTLRKHVISFKTNVHTVKDPRKTSSFAW